MVVCTVLAGVCQVRWFVVAALPCWRGRVMIGLWCGACCWVPWPPPAPRVWGVWLPGCPPGWLPGACWCGVGVLVGWWFEDWIVDASIGPPVVGGVGVRTVIRIREIVFLGSFVSCGGMPLWCVSVI